MCYYCIFTHRWSGPKTTDDNVPYLSDVLCNDLNLWPVDTCYMKKGLIVTGRNNINSHKYPETSSPSNLHDLFASLPQSLRDIIGHISFPPDDGVALLHSIYDSPSPRNFGASNTSFKLGRASHAWILSSGSTDDISNPLQNISG